MPGLFSCCLGSKSLKVKQQRNNDSGLNQKTILAPNEDSVEDINHMKSYHSDDAEFSDGAGEEDEDNMRGVSNVVYRKENVQAVYMFTSEELGVGATGPIRAVVNKATGGKFAMKTIRMTGLAPEKRERLIQEVLILARLHHPNIVKLYEVYETPDAMYLIMELLSGGELYTRLVNSPMGKFSEEYSKGVIKQILNAIAYLHETKNIAHRDLKLANIMFSDNTPDAEVKLIDFGLSKFVDDTDYMHSLVGTRYYIAPEVYMSNFKGVGYNKSCDMWSIGVISYFLLTGHNPLPPQMANLPFDQITIDHIPFPKRYWGELSEEAKDFVSALLQIDPAKRMTVLEAQKHPWFKTMPTAPLSNVSPSILDAMEEFQNYNHLKKAALTAVAYHLNNNDLMKLGDAFEYFDKRHDGVISFEEFRDALRTLQSQETIGKDTRLFEMTTDEAKLRQLFNSIDFAQCGYINYSEFVGACLARKEGMRREYADLIFRLIDRDHEDTISIEDLHLFFGDEISVEEIEAVIQQTFGHTKERLSEQDLERIMNTKMITNNNTEALATLKTQHIEGVYPDETYITVSSIFSRVGSYENPKKEASSAQPAPTLPVLQRRDRAQSGQDLDVIRRSNALSIADELATQSFKSLGANQPVIKSTGMSFGSLPLPELHS
ncbi:calcium-dependent protein kinase [Blastocystis sp. ATCC 50177/Nand II]|uniref:non-specific serine/threonine protein kinase n=1 Tax=Blastocystis sp. subtype 1 (strain ATCC 50177 / NandII) TaxID=478820 RepID=A0A196SCX9_BLAHN|nr:calcium-dependent protein kinase [Blastocystis sp. ATCC 50177/Nand II]